MLRGSSRIIDISLQNIAPQFLALAIYIYIGFGTNYDLNYKLALLIYGIAYAVTHIFTIFRLQVLVIDGFKKQLKPLFVENKNNGFNVYKGSLFGVLTSDILYVIVGALVSKSAFGMFALALSLSTPIQQIPATMGTVFFKNNSLKSSLSKQNIFFTVFFSLFSLLIMNIGIQYLFPVLFPNGYLDAVPYTIILSCGFMLHGLGDYFNQFISSHGFGKLIKKGAYISGITQVITALTFIPLLGIWGLVLARISTSIVYCICMIAFYNKVTKSLMLNKIEGK